MTDFEIPKGLSPLAQSAAEAIVHTARAFVGETASGGGCKAFYSPAEWRARGEEYGRNSELIVCHDGSDLARFFNYDYNDARAVEAMQKALKPLGLYSEGCTCWYSAIYKVTK